MKYRKLSIQILLIIASVATILLLVTIAIQYANNLVDSRKEERSTDLIKVRGIIKSVVDIDGKYEDDLLAVQEIKILLGRGKVTTEELGFWYPPDQSVSTTWLSRLRDIAQVQEAKRAVQRIQELRDGLEFERIKEKDVFLARQDLRMVEEAVRLVESRPMDLFFQSIPDDPEVIFVDQPEPPDLETAKSCLLQVKAALAMAEMPPTP